MKKHIILSFMTILLLSCNADKKNAIEHYHKAKESLKNDDIRSASTEIDIAISLDSSNLDFQIIKAKINEESENFEQAIKILKELSNRSFKSDTVNFYLGSCYFAYGGHFRRKKGDRDNANDSYRKSLTYYNNAISNNMQYFQAYVEKQSVLHNLERYDEALVVLSTAINLFPDSILLICNRGVEKIYLGDLVGAMNDLNKAIQSNTLDSIDLSIAYRFRGNLYFKRGNVDEAIVDLTNAINYNPNYESAFLARARCFKEKGLKDKACQDYRKAADLGLLIIYDTIREYCSD